MDKQAVARAWSPTYEDVHWCSLFSALYNVCRTSVNWAFLPISRTERHLTAVGSAPAGELIAFFQTEFRES